MFAYKGVKLIDATVSVERDNHGDHLIIKDPVYRMQKVNYVALNLL